MCCLMSDFPGGPLVKTLPNNAGGAGLISGQRIKVSICLMAQNPKHKIEAIL